jgi:hypothetical protein
MRKSYSCLGLKEGKRRGLRVQSWMVSLDGVSVMCLLKRYCTRGCISIIIRISFMGKVKEGVEQ